MWTPPNSPPEGIATADQIVGQAQEMGGAAYRTQPHSWVPQMDSQIPYWAGFTKTIDAFGQTDLHESTGVVGAAPPPDAPVGARRPRGAFDVSPQPPHPSSRHNVLSRASHEETTGEDPAPLFTHGQVTGRS